MAKTIWKYLLCFGLATIIITVLRYYDELWLQYTNAINSGIDEENLLEFDDGRATQAKDRNKMMSWVEPLPYINAKEVFVYGGNMTEELFERMIPVDTLDESKEAKKRNVELLEYNKLLEKSVIKEKRLPDAVHMGVKKCGTAWSLMLWQWHPAVVLTSDTPGLKGPKDEIKEVSEHQILLDTRKENVPDGKFYYVLCEPAGRTFSDFTHSLLFGKHYKLMNISRPKDLNFTKLFDRFIDIYLPKAKERLLQEELLLEKESKISQGVSIIKMSIYFPKIFKFLNNFSRGQLHIVNGERMIINPGQEMKKLQDFLGIPNFIIEDDFLLNPSTGLYCFRPTVYYRGKLYKIPTECLLNTKRKGRTRSTSENSKKPSDSAMSKLRAFYEEYNEKLFKLIGRRLW